MEIIPISKQRLSNQGLFPFGVSLRGILENASQDVSSSAFNTYRGMGFVLENRDIWLGYRAYNDSKRVQLVFHNLPEEVGKSLLRFNEFRVDFYGHDMLDGMPFAVDVSGKINEQTISCDALYVHRGDNKGIRCDHPDYCCVGRTVQGFREPQGPTAKNEIVNPLESWFGEGDFLLSRAASKYSLFDRLSIFNGERLLKS
jgi:hypothetical protein